MKAEGEAKEMYDDDALDGVIAITTGGFARFTEAWQEGLAGGGVAGSEGKAKSRIKYSYRR